MTARRRAPMRLAAGLALWTLAVPGQANGQTTEEVAGRWDVRWAQGVRTSGGTLLEVQRWGDAVLELEARGDTLRGRWSTNVLEEVNWNVSGTMRDGVLRLRGTEHDSENPDLDIVEAVELEATLEDGALEGTVLLRFRGAVHPSAPRPMTGTRGESGPG